MYSHKDMLVENNNMQTDLFSFTFILKRESVILSPCLSSSEHSSQPYTKSYLS